MKSYREWLLEKYRERFIYIKSRYENKQEKFATYEYGGFTFYSLNPAQRTIKLPYIFIERAIRFFHADDVNSFLVYNTKEKRFRKILRSKNTSLDEFMKWLDDCSWKNLWDIVN